VVDISHQLRSELAELPATTMAGFRAKARIVQHFNNCAPGYAASDMDDAMAWSLANDLLGVVSGHRSPFQVGSRLGADSQAAARGAAHPCLRPFRSGVVLEVEDPSGRLAQNVPPCPFVDERQGEQSARQIEVPVGPIRGVHQLRVRLNRL
jgi:hypothetical protein